MLLLCGNMLFDGCNLLLFYQWLYQWVIYHFLFTDMVDEMKVIVENFNNLTVEERNLLSVAYKNVIGARRAAWRIISSIEIKKKENSGSCEVTEKYKETVEKELTEIYQTVVELLDKYLIPNSETDEEKVFYNKM